MDIETVAEEPVAAVTVEETPMEITEAAPQAVVESEHIEEPIVAVETAPVETPVAVTKPARKTTATKPPYESNLYEQQKAARRQRMGTPAPSGDKPTPRTYHSTKPASRATRHAHFAAGLLRMAVVQGYLAQEDADTFIRHLPGFVDELAEPLFHIIHDSGNYPLGGEPVSPDAAMKVCQVLEAEMPKVTWKRFATMLMQNRRRPTDTNQGNFKTWFVWAPADAPRFKMAQQLEW